MIGTPEQIYTLEFTDDLTGTWIPFESFMAGPGGQSAVFENLEARPARRFYRVR